MASVIGVGDNTVDRYLHLGKMFPGGNAVNVPVLAHRRGHPAAYLGWLAKDRLGMLVYDSLVEEGVDVSHCRLVAGQNAFCNITQVDGDRVFGEYSEGVCGQISLDKQDFDFISGFDLVHTSVYSHINQYLKKLKSVSNCLSYDFSQEWDRFSLAETLPLVDIAFLSNPLENVNENRELMVWAASLGPRMIIITGGEKGALLYDGTQFYHQPVVKMKNIIDTLGAGDAFAACFMVDLIEGIDICVSLANAAEAAAEACTYYGAFGRGVDIMIKNKERIKEENQ